MSGCQAVANSFPLYSLADIRFIPLSPIPKVAHHFSAASVQASGSSVLNLFLRAKSKHPTLPAAPVSPSSKKDSPPPPAPPLPAATDRSTRLPTHNFSPTLLL